MKDFIHRLHLYFIPPKYYGNEELYRKIRIFINTTLITGFFAFFFLLNTIAFQMTYHVWSMIVCVTVFFSLAFLLRKNVSFAVCANTFIAVAAAATFWDGFYLGGLQSYDFIWMCIAPILAVMIIGRKAGWIWLGLTVTSITIMGLLQLKGYPFKTVIDQHFYHIHGLNAIISFVIVMFIIVLVMQSAFEMSLVKLDNKNKIIEQEKERSDELLLNILPAEVMEELKETGKTKARNYDLVTVLFADFVDFTSIIEEMPPEELVASIDDYFKMMDAIITKFNIEKIKTVGDAYICAAGLSNANNHSPITMISVAIEIMQAVQEINMIRQSAGKVCFELRIGVHSGPVVAGVVGVKKFAYDIWGDTVNTAARMQQCGDPGKINISGTTRELVKHRFNCVYRGRMEAKHKGLVDMYFVEGIKGSIPAFVSS